MTATATTEEFVAKALCVHKQKYIYDKTNYVGRSVKIIITCPIHGEFTQWPGNHLKGHGCSKCTYHKLSKLFVSNTDTFIQKANVVHNNTYCYDMVEYITNHKKIKVICKLHGSWLITPANHLTGYGCPNCGYNSSKPEKLWLDSLGIPDECRNLTIRVGSKRFKVDGLDIENKIIYEFNGDFWHGNPSKFHKDEINNRSGKTFGELHRLTLEKERELISYGYKVISIWESDWEKGKIL